MAEQIKLIDPFGISPEDLPLIVFSDNLKGNFFNNATKLHTDGFWPHIMFLHRLRGARPPFTTDNPTPMLATQGLTFREVPITNYMQHHRLKFWKLTNSNARQAMLFLINKQLNESFWNLPYDYLGLVGQLLGIPQLNIPWLKYCSERVGDILKNVDSDFHKSQPTPSYIDRFFVRSNKAFNGKYELLGYHIPNL